MLRCYSVGVTTTTQSRKQRVNVSLTAMHFDMLKNAAYKEGMQPGTMVRELILRWLEGKK